MKLLASLLALTLPFTALAEEPVVRLEIRTMHLRNASDIAMTYNVICDQRGYTLLASMSPKHRRATAIALLIGEGAGLRKVDLTPTELGQLMTDRTGFGELGFGCGGDGLYMRYLGATLADDKAPAVVQDALFRVSADGVVSRVPPPGVTVTPLR
ncbi:hypothetical protein [Roseateles sp. LYH14W]|uniref:Uncharacterized protein n=1 Tax=Pelomonas parva TaxID=3299032 RepID=A0ABW7EZA4_9BURK